MNFDSKATELTYKAIQKFAAREFNVAGIDINRDLEADPDDEDPVMEKAPEAILLTGQNLYNILDSLKILTMNASQGKNTLNRVQAARLNLYAESLIDFSYKCANASASLLKLLHRMPDGKITSETLKSTGYFDLNAFFYTIEEFGRNHFVFIKENSPESFDGEYEQGVIEVISNQISATIDILNKISKQYEETVFREVERIR